MALGLFWGGEVSRLPGSKTLNWRIVKKLSRVDQCGWAAWERNDGIGLVGTPPVHPAPAVSYHHKRRKRRCWWLQEGRGTQSTA